ncbi:MULTISPECIES: hypothetical protein [Burkholderia]|jgi:hypothetical protein|uniref:Uncharacterized protein n=2 Tax=Bacteria TaxID=2 RepID=A0A1E3FN33_9BURK|nr:MULTISPECIES: hypothetical protein [Burkholderia]ELK7724813.1 hypothetical protein [Burkholderia cenocepacia]UTP27778.1 hypothetical protein NMB33_40545 [Burkholderia sp. FXe9]HBN6128648.1 hypothetical protein [Clostridioides difficile]MBA9833451.1 hypothetical protein [Burkholderia contaminans]MBH9693726.1 hypothetical protein [Burkholderia contaminans]
MSKEQYKSSSGRYKSMFERVAHQFNDGANFARCNIRIRKPQAHIVFGRQHLDDGKLPFELSTDDALKMWKWAYEWLSIDSSKQPVFVSSARQSARLRVEHDSGVMVLAYEAIPTVDGLTVLLGSTWIPPEFFESLVRDVAAELEANAVQIVSVDRNVMVLQPGASDADVIARFREAASHGRPVLVAPVADSSDTE